MPHREAPHSNPTRRTIRKDQPLTRADIRDPSTVAQLYRVHHDDLYSMALNRLHSPELAEDAVQQAFANTISAVEEGAEVGHSGRWLNRCVQNVCLDMLRVATDAPLEEAHDLAQHMSLPESAELRERCRSIDSALSLLPAHLRSAFLLAEVRGLGYNEIAKRMHRSVDSVRQLIFRARQHVRELAGHENAMLAGPLLGLNAGLSSSGESRGKSLRGWLSLKLDALHAPFTSLLDRVAQAAHQPVLAILVACAVAVGLPAVAPTVLGPDSGATFPVAVDRETTDVSPPATRDLTGRHRARTGESSRPRAAAPPGSSNTGDTTPPDSAPPNRSEESPGRDTDKSHDQPDDGGDRGQESGGDGSGTDPDSSTETGYTPVDPPDEGAETGTSPMDDDSTGTSTQPTQKVKVAPILEAPAVRTKIAPYIDSGDEEGPTSSAPAVTKPVSQISPSIPLAPFTQSQATSPTPSAPIAQPSPATERAAAPTAAQK